MDRFGCIALYHKKTVTRYPYVCFLCGVGSPGLDPQQDVFRHPPPIWPSKSVAATLSYSSVSNHDEDPDAVMATLRKLRYNEVSQGTPLPPGHG